MVIQAVAKFSGLAGNLLFFTIHVQWQTQDNLADLPFFDDCFKGTPNATVIVDGGERTGSLTFGLFPPRNDRSRDVCRVRYVCRARSLRHADAEKCAGDYAAIFWRAGVDRDVGKGRVLTPRITWRINPTPASPSLGRQVKDLRHWHMI